MKKLRHRRCLELAVIAAALALVAVAPAGALAAGEESGGGSGETTVESPGGSTQPAPPATPPPATTAPPSSGWTSQGAGTGTSSGGAASVQHGSSVGSGGAREKAGSTSEEPSHTPSSSDYEPAPATPSTFEEHASTPRTGSGTERRIRSVEPPAPAARTSKAVKVAVGAATPLAFSKSSPGDEVRSGTPVAATVTGPGDHAASGSYALPLLIIIVLGLLGYAGVRLWRRRHKRRQREALWQRQDAAWEAAIRQIETERAHEASKPNAKRLQGVGVG